MPVVKSDRPPAKMKEPDFELVGNGNNIFLIDQVKYMKFNLALSSILEVKHKDAEHVGVFNFIDLQNQRVNRRPIFTMYPELVAQLMDMELYIGGLTVSADFVILVKKVRLPTLYDKEVSKFLKKYPFQTAASMLHHYGQSASTFVNRFARKLDTDYDAKSDHGAKIFTKNHPDAPKSFIPFTYTFGCRFIET